MELRKYISQGGRILIYQIMELQRQNKQGKF